MSSPEVFLKQLGLTDKEVCLYLALLKKGPASIRQMAEITGINRGTTYDVIKSLQERGLVSFFDEGKKAYFTATDPQRVAQLIHDKEQELESLKKQAQETVDQLQLLTRGQSQDKPVARYFRGAKAVRSILLEVIDDFKEAEKKEYFVYSSSSIAKHLYEAIPNFTKLRVKAGITVKVIAFGPSGKAGEALAERRWLTKDESSPTYTIIYGHKTAFISLGSQNEVHGVVIEDKNLSDSEVMVFKHLWNSLGKK